jgi:hypothetical protein
MNRRAFLGVLAGAAAAAALDPERLLWTPGQTTHVLAPAYGWRPDRCRCGQPIGFHKPVDVNALLKDAAQRLADRIDADGLRLYEEAHQLDAIRYAVYGMRGGKTTRMNELVAAQREVNRLNSEQLDAILIPYWSRPLIVDHPRRLGVVTALSDEP